MRYPPGSASRPVIGSCVVDWQQHIDAVPGSSAYWSTVLCSDITLRVAPTADEPPAQEPNQTTNHHNGGDGDPRDRAGREAAPVRAGRCAARPICTRSVPLDTLCAYLSIVCARLAVRWCAFLASVGVVPVPVSANSALIFSITVDTAIDITVIALSSVFAGFLN